MMRIIFLMMLIAPLSFAQSKKSSMMTVLPFSSANLSDVIIDSQLRVTRSDNAVTYLDIYTSCFGTNLRGVANPISPLSTIETSITYQDQGGGYQYYTVKFPAAAAVLKKNLNMDLSSESVIRDTPEGGVMAKWSAHLQGNLIRVRMENLKAQVIDSTAGTLFGSVPDANAKSALIKHVGFNQIMPPGTGGGQFMGANGPLSANLKWYFAENGKYVTIHASFPGENHFCGGYYSPLMLSFDDEVPSLQGESHFKLYKDAEKMKQLKLKYSWPVFKSKIYFLAQDLNGNGQVDNGSELFGDVNGYVDGFKNLEIYDGNKDGKIDAADEIFAKLFLWRDANGDGISQRSEIFQLSDFGIESISLSHQNELRYSGNRGKILGPGTFNYVDQKNKPRQGKVWDVFLTLLP